MSRRQFSAPNYNSSCFSSHHRTWYGLPSIWVDQARIRAHKDSAEGSSVLAGGRPEWILDQVTMPITPPSRPSFRFRSQHIPLSRFRATRVFSPTNSNIKSTSGWPPRNRCSLLLKLLTIRQFPPPPHGQYSLLERKSIQFFNISLFYIKKCLPRGFGCTRSVKYNGWECTTRVNNPAL